MIKAGDALMLVVGERDPDPWLYVVVDVDRGDDVFRAVMLGDGRVTWHGLRGAEDELGRRERGEKVGGAGWARP